MRKIKITGQKILNLLQEKQKISDTNLKRIKQTQQLQNDMQIDLSKVARIDEKVRPLIIKDVEKIELGEFEELSRVYVDKNNWYMEIVDRLEEFKIAFKKRSEKKDETNNNNSNTSKERNKGNKK